MKKRKQFPIDRHEILNGWLKYHDLDVDKLIASQPKEVLEDSEWFKLYPVTQEEYEEWVAWAKKHILDNYRISKTMLERSWWHIILDCSPYCPDYQLNR